MGNADGTGVIRRAVELFTDRVFADPALARYFVDIDAEALRSHQRAFLVAALGGPELYSGRDMRTAHADLAITDAEFDLAVAHLVAALEEAGVDAVAGARMRAQLEPLRHQIVAA